MSDRVIWQVGAGARGRDYSSIFYKHDVMFLGPGQCNADEQGYAKMKSQGYTQAKIKMVKSLRDTNIVKQDDIVLMRRGNTVLGIGVVAEGDYLYCDATFDDVYGWDLSHTRRVIWQDQLQDDINGLQLADGENANPLFANPLAGTLTRVRDGNVIDRLESLIGHCENRKLKELPAPLPKPLELEEVGRQLFARGLANSAVDQVLNAIERQRRLLNWYKVYGKESNRPDEQEVVAYMVVPLLLALGWSEQLLAVEWRRIDLAGFSAPPTTKDPLDYNKKCVLVCEAKGLDHGLMDDIIQALTYIDEHELDPEKVLITQGGRFYLYRRPKRGWPPMTSENSEHEGNAADNLKPDGYINVEKIRTDHIAPAGTDAIKTLIDLTPAGIAR